MPYTLDQLESFVSSAHYDSATAGLIARGVPTLKAADGELISPGVRRIRGNLCNVHGRYGPCDKALSGKKKPAKGRKPPKAKLTPAQRAAQRDAEHQANRGTTLTQQGHNSADQTALETLRDGAQPDKVSQDLIDQGVVEQATDGSYRLTSSGRALMSAAGQADAGRARDTVSGARDRVSARRARQEAARKRQQDAAGKRAAAQIDRELSKRQRQEQAAKKPAKAASGGSKQPEKPAAKRPARQQRRGQASGATSSSSSGGAAPKPEKPAKAPAKQIAPVLQTAADQLSQGATISDTDQQALIRNGLAKLNKEGELVLTAAGMRATTKAIDGRRKTEDGYQSFRIFKDANGQPRWVAQSSTAFQDRDREIVSTKALADDCRYADQTGSYGPLRWWHTPGLDLGDCDFNAMHGRVLIESGTFRSAAIAQKVAAAANGLEISLGFIHLPSEPDADGVFHHIRRFERSLVPRGKASNRFTAFRVKETRMFDPTKVAALKTLGFSDDDITSLQSQAEATEKAATDQGVAYKSVTDVPETMVVNGVTYKATLPPEEDMPYTVPPEIIVNGVTYKAFPPVAKDDGEGDIEVMVEEPIVEEVVDDPNGLSLTAGDLAAIGEAIQAAVATIMGGLDLEKKVAGHVQGLLAPYQTTKDAEAAQTKEQLSTLATQVADLTGSAPAAAYRPSAAKDNVLTDATMMAAAKQLNDPSVADPWADIKKGLGLAQSQ